jgi:hypothetical protein
MIIQGRSSVGRAPVSKTGGRGFKSLRPCQPHLGEEVLAEDSLDPFQRPRRGSVVEPRLHPSVIHAI